MRIVITGTSGRIGNAIARSLSRFHVVTGIDIKMGPYTDNVIDLRDRKTVAKLVKNAEAVIHCAALHVPHVNNVADKAFWQTNVEATRTLLEESSGHFVYTSTTSIFGDALANPSNAVWIDESVSPKPRDIYDVTKLEAEKLVESAAAANRPCTTLRISRCFPEQESLMAIYRLYRGVDSRDVVAAHELALGCATGYRMYVISGPTPFSKQDLKQLREDPWRCILKYKPHLEIEFEARDWAKPTVIDRVYSSNRATQEMGYRPRYGIEEFLNGDRQPQPS